MTVNIPKDDFVLFTSVDAIITAYVEAMMEKHPLLGEEKVRLAFASEIRTLKAAWKLWRKTFRTNTRQGVLAIVANDTARVYRTGCRRRGAAAGR